MITEHPPASLRTPAAQVADSADLYTLKEFLNANDAPLKIEYRCPRCRNCVQCRDAVDTEKKSLREEAEDLQIADSVILDFANRRIFCHLPLRGNEEEFLSSNYGAALKVLERQCKVYAKDPVTKEMITKAMNKLFDRGHVALLKDLQEDQRDYILSCKVNYYIPWRVVFKRSPSTPARPVFDCSSRTPARPDGSGGRCLNDLVVKGSFQSLNLIRMVLRFSVGTNALSGDIKQFYNCFKLSPSHWNLQLFLWKQSMDPEATTEVGVIKTLIYGNKSSAAQSEEGIRQLAAIVKPTNPSLADFLINSRFVDDLNDSKASKQDCDTLRRDTDAAFAALDVEIKGWAETGKTPSEEISEEGYVGVGGMAWCPAVDSFELKYSPLHFGSVSRGRLATGTETWPHGTYGNLEQMDKFVPQKLTKRIIASKFLSVFDITGKLIPLTSRMKRDLRRMIQDTPTWDEAVTDEHRTTWVKNFLDLERTKGIKFSRPRMPEDAVDTKMRLIVAVDAAKEIVIVWAGVGFKRTNGKWSSAYLIGRCLLAAQDSSIPRDEMEALVSGSNMLWILRILLANWVDSFLLVGDAQIPLFWALSDRKRLGLWHRSRAAQIRRGTPLENLFHIGTEFNIADVATRPDKLDLRTALGPGSIWEQGLPWMSKDLETLVQEGILTPATSLAMTMKPEEQRDYEQGFVFDKTPDVLTEGHFAHLATNRKELVYERAVSSNYLVLPTAMPFYKVVRVLGITAKFIRIFREKYGKQSTRPKPARMQNFDVFHSDPMTGEPSVGGAEVPGTARLSFRDALLGAKAGSCPPDSPTRCPVTCSHQCLKFCLACKQEVICKNVFNHFKTAHKLDMGAETDFSCPYLSLMVANSKDTQATDPTSPGEAVLGDKTDDCVTDPPALHQALLAEFGLLSSFTIGISRKKVAIKLSEKDLQDALAYLYTTASNEAKKFNKKEMLSRISIEKEGILYYKNRVAEGQRFLQAGEIQDLGFLRSAGINTLTPIIDRWSPLAYSIANHVHDNLAKHKGFETCTRISHGFVYIMKAFNIFQELAEDCITCKKLRKRFLQAAFGNIHPDKFTLAPPFWTAQADLWGPITVYVPGREKNTRSSKSLNAKVHCLVFVCVVTKLVNIQVVESKSVEGICDGITRLACEQGMPANLLVDQETSLMKSLREGELTLQNLQHEITTKAKVNFNVCPVTGHNAHGLVESKIKTAQRGLEASGAGNVRLHATGVQTLCKLIETDLNNTPLGLSYARSEANTPLLRLLSPQMMKLGRINSRIPIGPFTLPSGPRPMMEKVESAYKIWYREYRDTLLLKYLLDLQPKWFKSDKDTKVEDVVYFRKREGALDGPWTMGVVNEVTRSSDGVIRRVSIKYFNASESSPRFTDRSIRKIVKLFNVEDGSWRDDMENIQQLLKELSIDIDVSETAPPNTEDQEVSDEVFEDSTTTITGELSDNERDDTAEIAPSTAESAEDTVSVGCSIGSALLCDCCCPAHCRLAQHVGRAGTAHVKHMDFTLIEEQQNMLFNYASPDEHDESHLDLACYTKEDDCFLSLLTSLNSDFSL